MSVKIEKLVSLLQFLKNVQPPKRPMELMSVLHNWAAVVRCYKCNAIAILNYLNQHSYEMTRSNKADDKYGIT